MNGPQQAASDGPPHGQAGWEVGRVGMAAIIRHFPKPGTDHHFAKSEKPGTDHHFPESEKPGTNPIS
jgi:hypothetical protein